MGARPPATSGWAILAVACAACVPALKEQCGDAFGPAALPSGFAEVDRAVAQRSTAMIRVVEALRGPVVGTYRVSFAMEALPILCGRLEEARRLAAAGRAREAGQKYQALLVATQVFELAMALHAFSQYADEIGVPTQRILQARELFSQQMAPLLDAALSEDPGRIERALAEHGGEYTAWVEALRRWTGLVNAQAPNLKTARMVWDLLTLVVATYDAAEVAADLAEVGGPPLSGLATVGGAGAAALDGAAYLELVEALRKLIASGAVDAGIVVGLSHLGGASVPSGLELPTAMQMSGPRPPAKSYPPDKPNRQPINRNATYHSERDARSFARNALGKNPVQVAPGKLRSLDGRWQYRVLPDDIEGLHGRGPHIHLEHLDPVTGDVLENWHLYW